MSTMDEERVISLRKQLTSHRRNLWRLEEKLAKYTELEAPVALLNQIDDEREAIARIEDELRQLGALDDVEALRQDYLAYLAQRYEYMDLGGISPKVGGKVVKIRMADLFVPLQAEQEAPLLSRFAAEELALAEREDLADQDRAALQSDLADRYVHEFGAEGQVGPPVSIAEVLAEPHAVALGDPGTGKSTLLKYMAYGLAIGLRGHPTDDAGMDEIDLGEAVTGRLPILVRIADFAAAKAKTPELRLVDYVRDRHLPEFASLLQAALETDNCLILLDGLDEVVDPGTRGAVASDIADFVARYQANRFLVTSRVVGYRQAPLAGAFAHFTLREWGDEAIERFVGNWYQAIETEAGGGEESVQERVDELMEAIRAKPGVRRLAGNPLLLTIIALINWRGTKLPNRRVELYQIATETLIENWPLSQRGIDLDAEEILTILAPIAYHIFATRSSGVIGERELGPLFERGVMDVRCCDQAEARRISRELLRTLSEHTGFFLERGLDEHNRPVYGFLHLTFAEYLTARHLAALWDLGREDWIAVAHRPRWREVILLMAGHVGTWGRGPATRLLQEVRELESTYHQYEVYLHRNLLLAGAILADDVRVQMEVGREVVEELLGLWKETEFELLHEMATVTIAALPDTSYGDQVVSQLKSYLSSPDPTARGRAAEALGRARVAKPEITEALFKALGDRSAWVRSKASEALSEIGAHPENVIPALVPILEDDDPVVRKSAVEALTRIGLASRPVVDGLLTRLEDEHWQVRESAVMALRRLKATGPRVVTGLLKARSDKEASVKWKADGALTELSERMEEDEKEVENALRALEAPGAEERREAAVALGFYGKGNPKVIEALLRSLSDSDPRVRKKVLQALYRLEPGDERVSEVILRALTDPAPEVRGYAILVLRELKQAGLQMIPNLLEALGDENPYVRRSAVISLAHLGLTKEEVLTKILPLLKDCDPLVRAVTASDLARFGVVADKVIDSLKAALEDDDPNVRGQAAGALARLKASREDVLDSLVCLLSEEGYSLSWDLASKHFRGKRRVKDGALEALWALCGES